MINWRAKSAQYLRWSEKYTRTDMVYLAKSGFWVLFGQTTSSLLSLILIIVFANMVSKETYGLYRYVLSLAGILNIFTLTGMNQAVIQAVAAGKESALRASVRYQLKWNTLMLLASIALSIYYIFNDNPTLAISFLTIGLFSPLATSLNTYNAYLAGKKKYAQINILSSVATLLYVGGMITAIYLVGDSVIWLVAAYSITIFLSNLAGYIWTVKVYRPPQLSRSQNEDGEILRYGRQLTFIDYIAPIASKIDSVLLNHFWGSASLAVYTLATAIPNRATVMLKSYTGIGFPKFAEKTSRELNSIFWYRIFQGLAVGLACAVAYVLIAPPFFHYLLPKYLDGLFYSQLLAASLIFALPNRYISLLLTSQKLSRAILTNSVIQNLTQISLYALLGISGGILGLIIAKISYSCVALVIGIIIWKRATKEKMV